MIVHKQNLCCGLLLTTAFYLIGCAHKDSNIAPATINEQYIDSAVRAKADSFRNKLKAQNDSIIHDAGVDYADSVKMAEQNVERQPPPPLPPQRPLSNDKKIK